MTSTERRRTWSERLDPRNWSLVAKLAIVGLVPTVLALAIGAVRVVDQANVAEELGQGSGLVEAHQQVGALTQALQAERSAAVVFVGGNRLGDRNAVDSAQAATDQALQRANATLATAEQQAPQIATARRQADTTLGQLPVIRSQVANPPTPAIDVTTRYTAVVQRTLALDRALIAQLQTSDTAGLAGALGSTASATEALELERTVLGGAIAASQLTEQQRALVNGAEASFQAAASDFQAALTPQQVDRLGNFAAEPANDARQTLRDQIMATPDEGRVTADPAAWNAAVDASTTVVRSADDQAEQQFVDGRAQAAEEAGNTAGLNSVLLMLGILLTVGIILLLGRQLVRSLRVLRTSALDVAERKLPQAVQGMRAGQAPSALVEPVPLESRDEIGQVARAFDAVHGQAIRLAADQAALQQNVNSMFVNLSRRSQALVERQLQLIEQLESNEQDPDQLSNLFQLDHLATRMRRNSENLLVLAGTDLAKRNVAPVQVVDVLRAAVSEVEQYQRVVVQTPPTATIAGRAANDVVHLLAELLDNATNFSPPDSQVVMSTTRTADESLLIEISDRGVGMADSELSDANQRLSGPSEVDVSASRRMGLFVVGRLAARHRIGVRLSSASGAGRTGGLSASVTVPPQLVPSSIPVIEQPPAMVGAGDRGAVAPAPPMPALERPEPSEPPEPVVRNGSPAGSSTITGTDGPVAPTFGSGSAGSTRNGSAAKLPTRTPGSALRQNPPDTNGSTNGRGAAPNGSHVTGINAFAPSGPGRDGGSTTNGPTTSGPTTNGSTADVFSPGPDAPSSSGAYRPVPGTNGVAPAADLRGPGTGRSGPDTGAEPPGTEDGDTTDPRDGAPSTPDAASDTAAEDTHGAPGGNGRTVLGAAAAGVGGAMAGAFSRRGRSDDTGDDGREAADQDASAHGNTRDVAGHTPADRADHTVRTDPGDGADRDPEALAGDTDADRDGTADDLLAEADGTADVVDGQAPDPVRAEAGDRPDGQADAEAADLDGEADAEVGEEPGDDADAGYRDDGSTGHTHDDPDQDSFDAPHGPWGTDEREPAAGEPDDEPDTTAFPTVRPPRERMGTPRSGPGPVRPGPLRPAPARRPVMPGTSPDPRPDERRPGDVRPAGPAPVGPGAAPGRSARADQDELFAPAVPVEGDRGQLRRPGGLETARSGSGYDISQTTPIFEEIASAWFRSNRSVPVRWEDGGPDRNGTTAGTAPGAAGTRPPQPGRPGPGAGAAPRPTPGPRPTTGATPLASDQGAGVTAGADPAGGRPAGEDAGFASPADDVWRQAAAGAGDAEQQPDEVTSAGLPKRRPRARLLPGSAAGSTVLTQPSSEPRNADTVRGRLASYQQGVRQGRESASARTAHTGEDAPDPSAGDRRNTSDHEETT